MADHITGTYPGGPSAEHTDSASLPSPAIHGIADVEMLRERLDLRRRHRRRVKHAIAVLLLGSALAVSTGVYLGFEAHTSLETPVEEVVRASGDLDLTDEMRWLLDELWRKENMERLPRR